MDATGRDGTHTRAGIDVREPTHRLGMAGTAAETGACSGRQSRADHGKDGTVEGTYHRARRRKGVHREAGRPVRSTRLCSRTRRTRGVPEARGKLRFESRTGGTDPPTHAKTQHRGKVRGRTTATGGRKRRPVKTRHTIQPTDRMRDERFVQLECQGARADPTYNTHIEEEWHDKARIVWHRKNSFICCGTDQEQRCIVHMPGGRPLGAGLMGSSMARSMS
mmetsp:Transcript_7502/g.26753  ORF Transcript_7502/g.26753 Transcript_7502/m.26753 type:complete len:221 (-) Transcript_7502:505-1167(-)